MEVLARINPVSYVIVRAPLAGHRRLGLGQARRLPGRDRRPDRRPHRAVAAGDRDLRPRLGRRRSAVFGVREVEAAAGVPLRCAGCRARGCRRRPSASARGAAGSRS